ncbi:MAG TPA: DEAD/DEAH box helicase [Desulfobacteraceae bacterium]|nr:DEAD/DEAH box helicase [Desulfobacteraceae bacterium]
MLLCISVIYEPVSAAFLLTCMQKADFGELGTFRPRKEDLQAAITGLRRKKLLDEKNRLPQPLVEYVTRHAIVLGIFPGLAAVIEKQAPVSYQYGKRTTRCWRAMRQFRIGVYSRDFDKIEEAQIFLDEHCRTSFAGKAPAVPVAAEAFDPGWFGGLPGSLQFYLLEQILRDSMARLQHYPPVLDYLEDESVITVSPDEQVPFHRLLAGYLLLQGRLDNLEQLLDRHADSFKASGFAGTVAFLRGDSDDAFALFDADLRTLHDFFGDRRAFFFGLPGLFCLLALLERNRDEDRALIKGYVSSALDRYSGCPEEVPYLFINAVAGSMDDEMSDMMELTEQLRAHDSSLTRLLATFCLYWMGVEIPDEFRERLVSLHERAAGNGFSWLAMESAMLLDELGKSERDYGIIGEAYRRDLRCRSIVQIIETGTSWKHSLQELINLTSTVKEQERNTRLAWMVRYEDGTLHLVPKEQKKKASGEWSKGRTLALSRLADQIDLEYLTAPDRRICAALTPVDEESGRAGGYVFDLEAALPALIGHPLVFLEKSPQTPVEIVAGEPELLVEQQGDYLFIHFTQDIGEGNVAIWQETPTRFKVIRVGDNHRRVAAITGRKGLRVPLSASAQLLEVIGSIASFMTVHSSMGVDIVNRDVEFVEADPTIHLHFIPYGSGFRLEMFVQPFPGGGPYLKPGAGVANIVAEVNGRRLQTRRNLRLEEEKAREIEESCPILDLAIDLEQENKREWHLFDPEECLQALLELEEIRDRIVLEWPEGGKLSVSRQTGVNQLNLNIRTSQQDWFGISGTLDINQDEVIELKTLLDRVKQSRSRFIPIGDSQFLALTQEFRKRLNELILLSESKHENRDNEVFIHPLAALALEDLTQEAKTRADEGWKKRLRLIREAQELAPEVPSTLQAELRDYQVEGFVWMAQLAHLGVGACLADDMGLGKTLQALAVILHLARNGPTLVVAPTSVCMNWEQEIIRFAPTLRVHMFSGAGRKDKVDSLGKFDILITSYTLLQQEIRLLESVEWQTIVLDEAQAIKNAGTKRSRAAMRLKGRFRLVTTGTPIENHLGELWNLFRFINPGLLGTFKQFNARFGIPIEKHHDREAKKRLKKTIRPFMLRRIKSQVLDELPPRTEVSLRVEMMPPEMRFYEALRQQALENIESSSEKSGRHMQILAEIMKLRRACCNPRLIVPDIDIPSAKMQVFVEVVEELIGSRHKALVFSQFTGHLALIREYLDNEGIFYKYLDGTTPIRERQRQVESFQEGEGDLFLISLKAGGLGLNLTVADYVIHMDPWWNPAVEDQAADRAHRIGQKRPVTVYRLVTANTIEEKIVKLHQEKRDLANSLLEGTDVSARISAEELLELIREH